MLIAFILILIYYFMKTTSQGTSNQEVMKTLDALNRNSRVQNLVFDPKTGEFVVQHENEINPDSTTINSIARDGFAGQ